MRASSKELGVQGRQLFLSAVADAKPEVLRSLKQSVFPICREALAQDHENYLEGRKRGVIEMWQSPLWEDFEHALQQWAEPWNLTDHWILEAARHTAHTWDLEERSGDQPQPGWLYPKYYYMSAPLVMEVSGWEPSVEARREAEERIGGQVGRQIRVYLDDVEALAKRQGYKPLPPMRRREPITSRVPRHYRWLAEWQVCRRTHAEIAERHGVKDAKIVGEAIRRIASAIGLTRRTTR